jgi:putative ABC transport system ATP-binding protein
MFRIEHPIDLFLPRRAVGVGHRGDAAPAPATGEGPEPTHTAVENVMLAAEYAGVGRAAARTAALEALSWVGLAERADHRPMELSGGEQQRVALARALVNEPMLLLAGEPTGNLDSARSAEVPALLRRLNRERGQTTVLVTHEPQVAAACDRIIQHA